MHNLFFLFPLVLDIDLFHFFFDKQQDGATRNSIVHFRASTPVTQPFDRCKTKSATFTKNGNCFEKCNVLDNRKRELSAF